MPLTNTTIKNAQPGAKDRKLTDEKGLYLLITPKGSKLWRMKFRHHGIERKLTFGEWPLVSLQEARLLRDRHLERAPASLTGDGMAAVRELPSTGG